MDELLEYYAEHEPTIVHIQMRNYFDKKANKKQFKVYIALLGSAQCFKLLLYNRPHPSYYLFGMHAA